MLHLTSIDTFDYSKYDIDIRMGMNIYFAWLIFFCKVYCIAMQNRDNNDVLNAFKNILTKSNKPIMIISDSDSTFK